MRILIPIWQGRVSPVFDSAARAVLLDIPGEPIGDTEEVCFTDGGPAERIRRMRDWGVDQVICGAISRPMESAMHAAGISVQPYICGAVEAVLDAYVHDQLDQEQFMMPGCCGRRRRRRGGGRGRGRPRANE
jgi:predicted Fe-Mo cluster-binding NifX family protein